MLDRVFPDGDDDTIFRGYAPGTEPQTILFMRDVDQMLVYRDLNYPPRHDETDQNDHWQRLCDLYPKRGNLSLNEVESDGLAEDVIGSEAEHICNICLEEYDPQFAYHCSQCKCEWHEECILEWLDNDCGCPICRACGKGHSEEDCPREQRKRDEEQLEAEAWRWRGEDEDGQEYVSDMDSDTEDFEESEYESGPEPDWEPEESDYPSAPEIDWEIPDGPISQEEIETLFLRDDNASLAMVTRVAERTAYSTCI